MFDQVVESLKKATEASVQVQQEMLNKWMSLWTGTPALGPLVAAAFPLQRVQQRWADAIKDVLQRQREVIDKSFKTGQQNIQEAFKLGEVKSPEEMQRKTIELWQKCLDSLRETNEMHIREFHAAMEKWLNLMAKPVG